MRTFRLAGVTLLSGRRAALRRVVWSLVALGAACVALGCNKPPKLAEVKGRVTFKGQPVSGGATVLFENTEAGAAIVAPLDANGNYRVGLAEGFGLPPATYQVSVLPPPLTPNFPSIPRKYRDPQTSGLVLELTPQGAEFDIEMRPE